MQKISKKSKDKLYDVVFNDIMNARIKIAKLTNDSEVDNILSDLTISCPQRAIDCFKRSGNIMKDENKDENLAFLINKKTEELIQELRHFREKHKNADNPINDRIIFESWAIQKIAGIHVILLLQADPFYAISDTLNQSESELFQEAKNKKS